jgi:anti-anti-sigma factor
MVERQPERVVVAVSGALAVGNAPRLQEALVPLMGDADVVVDLDGLTFVDSSGLTVFIAAYKTGVQHGTNIVLDRVPGFLARVLKVTGLDQLLLASKQNN